MKRNRNQPYGREYWASTDKDDTKGLRKEQFVDFGHDIGFILLRNSKKKRKRRMLVGGKGR